MLEHLHIRNLALIEDMSLEFSEGMNVLTGETGAGKSFILKALGFLLGDRLDAAMVRKGADRAQVEALFSLNDGDLVIRRELLAEKGRSRVYVNDTLHSQDALRRMRDRLVTYTSQHAQQQLLQPAFQSRLVEGLFPDKGLLGRRNALLEELRGIARRRDALLARQNSLAEKRELLEMQQREIDKVAPEENEEEKLEARRAAGRSAEKMRKNNEAALECLYGGDSSGLLSDLRAFGRILRDMAADDENLVEPLETLDLLDQQLSELAGRLQRAPISTEEQDLNEIEERLYALAQLKRRLKRTLPEILSLRREIAENLSFLDVCALDMKQIEREEDEAVQRLKAVIEEIVPLRHDLAQDFTAKLEAGLRELGFSKGVRVIPEFSTHELWPGVDDQKVRLLWGPNPGQPPQPLDRIASGGELSRFLLALVSLRSDADESTYIFDEVDAGVGGLTLGKLAEKLDFLAGHRQMLLITHWPQLAARAKRHFQISKDIRGGETFTTCRMLDSAARHAELVRMAGGGALGETTAHALGAQKGKSK
ncbi:MAG: AAA family ATPase [Desulfovibrio sp.]|nr:AAA family ATPase [Desulfovibrio sp.]